MFGKLSLDSMVCERNVAWIRHVLDQGVPSIRQFAHHRRSHVFGFVHQRHERQRLCPRQCFVCLGEDEHGVLRDLARIGSTAGLGLLQNGFVLLVLVLGKLRDARASTSSVERPAVVRALQLPVLQPSFRERCLSMWTCVFEASPLTSVVFPKHQVPTKQRGLRRSSVVQVFDERHRIPLGFPIQDVWRFRRSRTCSCTCSGTSTRIPTERVPTAAKRHRSLRLACPRGLDRSTDGKGGHPTSMEARTASHGRLDAVAIALPSYLRHNAEAVDHGAQLVFGFPPLATVGTYGHDVQAVLESGGGHQHVRTAYELVLVKRKSTLCILVDVHVHDLVRFDGVSRQFRTKSVDELFQVQEIFDANVGVESDVCKTHDWCNDHRQVSIFGTLETQVQFRPTQVGDGDRHFFPRGRHFEVVRWYFRPTNPMSA
mmetsp:Transcript_4401/g.28061  ORF Transcript_4401/g.28061 Transcript_4401/m.28061 type:complete len:428 (-) Transcript_4401:277-1560(-)